MKSFETMVNDIKDSEKKENEIDPTLREKLVEYSSELEKIEGDYATVYEYFEPYGAGGRKFDDEFSDFLQKRKTDPDYCPVFEYPKLDEVDPEKLDKDSQALREIRNKLEKEENEELKIVVTNALEVTESKIEMLKNIKNGDFDKAFACAKRAFGDINEELVKIAQELYEQKKNDTAKKRAEKENKQEEKGAEGEGEEIKKKLESVNFEADDFQNYFEMLIKNAGFDKDGWEVIITDEVKALDVRSSSKDYDHPVILIPRERKKDKNGKEEKVDGVKFLKLLNHEFTHIITQTYNRRNGYGSVTFGPDYEVFTEGIAKMAEDEIEKEALDKPEEEAEILASPYYVLAINKAKEGANFRQVFDYLVELKKQELESGGTGSKKAEEKAITDMKGYARRIFRGFNPKEGGKYFPKDKAYLQGEIGARKMEDEGIADYLYESKVDPEMIPYLNKLGAYVQKEGLSAAREVVKKMWKDKNWPQDLILNRKWYQENTQMDRHWAYRREFQEKMDDEN